MPAPSWSIAAGGDGTVRAVAEVLAGTAVPLALLPSGTGNLLARNLKLTLNDTADSLRTAFAGKQREIDVARIDIRRRDDSTDSHVFLVMAGTGLDAQIMDNTDDDVKKKVGWLAYAHALVVVLRDKNDSATELPARRPSHPHRAGAGAHHRQLRVAAGQHHAASRRGGR